MFYVWKFVLPTLIRKCKIFLISVDGSIPSIKLSTYRRRLGSVSEVWRTSIA